jgi:hypothetical protein
MGVFWPVGGFFYVGSVDQQCKVRIAGAWGNGRKYDKKGGFVPQVPERFLILWNTRQNEQ